MASKSPDAFRTISEVADWLNTPAHVLRFWESKFSQVKPVKRAGGRRYYRPADMALIGGIKKLLHDDGMTIKGVQKLLREQGIKHVAALSPPLDEDLEQMVEPTMATPPKRTEQQPESETGRVLNFAAKPDTPTSAFTALDGVEQAPVASGDPFESIEEGGENLFSEEIDAEPVGTLFQDDHIDPPASETPPAAQAENAAPQQPPQEPTREPRAEPEPKPEPASAPEPTAIEPAAQTEVDPSEPAQAPTEETPAKPLPSFLQKPMTPSEPEVTSEPVAEPESTAPATISEPTPDPMVEEQDEPQAPGPAPAEVPETAPQSPVPQVEAQPTGETTDDATPAPDTAPEPSAPEDIAPEDIAPDAADPAPETAPRTSPPVAVPVDPGDHDIAAEGAVLTRLAQGSLPDRVDAAAMTRLVKRLRAHEEKMTEAGRN